MMKKILILLVFLLIIPIISAKEYHMKLLAIRDVDENTGSDADLYLEIIPGSGRIFLDTFPMTRFDTQISTRFAKEIACNFLDISCDNHDFIYTIRSNSAIIGGPSASAAISVLTVAALKKIKIDENTSITGIINSGGVISPIGGLKGKIDIGAQIGLKKILIPKGQRILKISNSTSLNISQNDTNETFQTIDLIEYGRNKGVKVIEVSDLNEALYEFTGIKFYKNNKNLTINANYLETMNGLALDLCSRSKELRKWISLPLPKDMLVIYDDANNLTRKANDAYKNKEYYSTASYCYGANTKYGYIKLWQENDSFSSLINYSNRLLEDINKFKLELEDRDIKTITDLETYMVVNERLTEAEEYLRSINSEKENVNEATINIAFALERFSSARSWYKFFDNRGKEFILDKEILKKSCQDKLSESEERLQYVSTFFPEPLIKVRDELNNAFIDLQKQNYKLCLFKASKAKAEVDIILSSLGISDVNMDTLLKTKLELAQKNIIKQMDNDIFPILGYSYYEYANSLKTTDQFSALLFTEYALELSNLDLYFEQKKQIYLFDLNLKMVVTLGIGIILGVAISVIIFLRYKTFNKHPRKKRITNIKNSNKS